MYLFNFSFSQSLSRCNRFWLRRRVSKTIASAFLFFVDAALRAAAAQSALDARYERLQCGLTALAADSAVSVWRPMSMRWRLSAARQEHKAIEAVMAATRGSLPLVAKLQRVFAVDRSGESAAFAGACSRVGTRMTSASRALALSDEFARIHLLQPTPAATGVDCCGTALASSTLSAFSPTDCAWRRNRRQRLDICARRLIAHRVDSRAPRRLTRGVAFRRAWPGLARAAIWPTCLASARNIVVRRATSRLVWLAVGRRGCALSVFFCCVAPRHAAAVRRGAWRDAARGPPSAGCLPRDDRRVERRLRRRLMVRSLSTSSRPS